MPKESISGKSRTYRSELRRQQADQTRRRIVESAAELFAADGYARTTLARIAGRAGVSTETVQGSGPKAALLVAALEYAAFGVAGEEDVLNLDIGRTLMAIKTLPESTHFFVDFQAEVHEKTARLWLALIGGASSDSELDVHLTDLLAGVSAQHRRTLEIYRDRGWVRDDVPFEEVVETTAVLCSADTYLRITHRDGWSLEAYRKWLGRMLTESVSAPSERG